MKSKLKKMSLTIDLYKKQNITTFLLFVFCLFLLFFCFCYKVEENCGVLVHKPQRLLLENFSCYKDVVILCLFSKTFVLIVFFMLTF